LATLAGAYRLSKRQIQPPVGEGLSISVGMISKLGRQSAAALAVPYQELADSVHQAEVVNIDETGWRQDRRKAWLWVTVTAMATVFTIAARRSARVARGLLDANAYVSGARSLTSPVGVSHGHSDRT
jgi:transposase